MDAGWDIRLCGPVLVESSGARLDAGLPGRQGRLLFAYLVLNRSRGCPRDELVDALWPEGPPAAADSALSALLSKLRRALGDGVLTGRGELRLRLEGPVQVDIERSRAAIVEAEAAMEAGDHALAAARTREALATDLQTFLPDAETGWAAEQRRELETLRLRGLEMLAEAGLRQGGRELGSAEQAARAAIAAAPFRESAHRLLMEIHEAAGNPAEALRAFEELRSLLREELGTTPGQAAMAVFERVLRGEPPPVVRSVPPPVAAVALEPAPWPAPLAAAVDRHPLIGRTVELGFLERCWREAADGQRALVLLAGDAGIGKTRLAAEAAELAHRDGAAVLYGRFDEETLTPYQPVVEMLRGWSAGAPLDVLRDRIGPRAAELSILLPEFGAPPADHNTSSAGLGGGEADAQRFRFFDAVAALLGEIGADAPVVLVFDDLQWADRPTLQLLRHLVRAPAPRRALFLGTYRESEISDRDPLHELIGDLRREGTMRRLELGGLGEAEVGDLVAELSSSPASESFVRALAGETEGNPFFIEEVVRHIRDTAGALSEEVTLEEAGVPDGVREVTARRLRRLSEPTRAVLLVASVIGREFDYDVLADVVAQGDDELVEALEEGVEARVLREIGHVGRYGFTHGLVRATLYEQISQLRRARLHGRVGEALVQRRGGDLDPHLALLAHHFAQAAPVERPDRAIDFALAAARRADRMLAWEEAAQHYRAALRARELSGAVDDHVRAELLLALGASEERAGLEQEARESFSAAIRTARQLGDPVLLTRGVLGQAGPWSALSRSDPERVALLDEAMEALPEDDSPLRARLLARMSLELYYAGEPELRLSLSEEAVRVARRIGDPRTLASCLDARHYALWRPENVEERLVVAAELREVAEQTGDPELELQGAAWTIIDLMELGDIDGVDIQIAAVSKLADALHRPIWLWWASLFRGSRAQLDGRFDEAERLAQETLVIGQRGQAENALHYYAQEMYSIRREQGRLAEVEGAVRNFIELYPAIPAWRSSLALLLIELGRPEEARAEFEAMATGGFNIPRDANWLVAVTLLAEVCGALGDADRAPELYALIEPYAGRNIVVGRNATFNGCASWLLGLLAAAQGQYDRAERHYEDAQKMHAAMGAKPWYTRTQVVFAELLLARRGPGDVERAAEMLADAVVVADALGMVVLAERARRLVPAATSAP